MTVGAHIKRVKVHENRFAEYYGLTVNHDQKKGAAWDCEIPGSGERIEFKADFSGSKTGNHFVEFRYSNDHGETWDDSGIVLAKDQAEYWVVYLGVNHDSYYWFRPQDILKLIEQNNYKTVGIRRNLYGNRDSIRCEGWLVPLADLANIEIEAPLDPIE